jgi:hypothetical protein
MAGKGQSLQNLAQEHLGMAISLSRFDVVDPCG